MVPIAIMVHLDEKRVAIKDSRKAYPVALQLGNHDFATRKLRVSKRLGAYFPLVEGRWKNDRKHVLKVHQEALKIFLRPIREAFGRWLVYLSFYLFFSSFFFSLLPLEGFEVICVLRFVRISSLDGLILGGPDAGWWYYWRRFFVTGWREQSLPLLGAFLLNAHATPANAQRNPSSPTKLGQPLKSGPLSLFFLFLFFFSFFFFFFFFFLPPVLPFFHISSWSSSCTLDLVVAQWHSSMKPRPLELHQLLGPINSWGRFPWST